MGSELTADGDRMGKRRDDHKVKQKQGTKKAAGGINNDVTFFF